MTAVYTPKPMKGFNISSPIAMTWRLTTPNHSRSPLSNLNDYEPPNSKHLIMMAPTRESNVMKSEQTSVNCNDNNMIRTLIQYNHHTNYRVYSTIVLNGFIHDLQDQLTSTVHVPQDIIDICFSFYYEEANQSIHFAYNLYQLLHQHTATNIATGKTMFSLIKSNGLHRQYDKEIIQLLNDLVRYKFIRIISYKSSFSAILNSNYAKSGCMSFNNDPSRCTYKFTHDVSDAFEEYSVHKTQ